MMAKKKSAKGSSSNTNGTSENSPVSKKSAKKKAVRFKRALTIERKFPEGQRATFANHFAVQHENGVFHLLFFEIDPPLVFGDDDERRKALSKMETIEANCVARIVVSDDVFPGIAETMGENYERFQARATGNVEEVDLDQMADENTPPGTDGH